jgi:hypothetical protein
MTTAPEGTDATAIKVLEEIKRLALSLYPFAEGSDIHPQRAFALGNIAGIASKALAAREPPR